MASLIYYRDQKIYSPIPTWDDIEAAITFVEEAIYTYDTGFTVTPFVPGTRTSTWVLTKTEIQGLEDRLHTIAEYLGIPHIKTTWSGLMPINYNAMNHLVMALMPQSFIDNFFDTSGDLAALMPEDYDWDIDYLDMFKGGTPSTALDDLIVSRLPGTAILAGASTGNVYRSTDGAASWEFVTQIEEAAIYAMAGNPDGSFLASTSTGIYKSSDNGDTWTLMQSTGGYTVLSLVVVQYGIVFGFAGTRMYITSNDGDTWVYAPTPGGLELTLAVYIPGGNLVAYNPSDYKLYESDDYGESWTELFEFSSAYLVLALACVGGSTLYASNSSEWFMQSEDGGATWNMSAGGSMGILVYSILAITGEVLGATLTMGPPVVGQIVRISSGGTAWTTPAQTLGSETQINALAMPT